jgi:hypothetical protein
MTHSAGDRIGHYAILAFNRVTPAVSDAAEVAAALTPLISDAGFEGEPTFSLDGETVAYVSDRTGNLEILLKQVSGGPPP